MGDIHYMISEAAKEVGVESHVLRYWEEELSITIGRTEMGHRYYTEDDIQLFHCIRKLKDEGVLLKELKILVPELQHAKKLKCLSIVEEIPSNDKDKMKHTSDEQLGKNFQNILEQALQKNNMTLEQGICSMVTDSMKREMTYLLDAKEQLEEERYRRLDTLLRQQQMLRKENSKKGMPILLKQVFGM